MNAWQAAYKVLEATGFEPTAEEMEAALEAALEAIRKEPSCFLIGTRIRLAVERHGHWILGEPGDPFPEGLTEVEWKPFSEAQLRQTARQTVTNILTGHRLMVNADSFGDALGG